jgi:hypothetical protein
LGNYISDPASLSSRSPEERRLSDWSIAFIVLSLYDASTGYFFVDYDYKGLAIFVLNILQSDGFEIVIFRLCVAVLWLVCLALAVEVDNPFSDNA